MQQVFSTHTHASRCRPLALLLPGKKTLAPPSTPVTSLSHPTRHAKRFISFVVLLWWFPKGTTQGCSRRTKLCLPSTRSGELCVPVRRVLLYWWRSEKLDTVFSLAGGLVFCQGSELGSRQGWSFFSLQSSCSLIVIPKRANQALYQTPDNACPRRVSDA